MPQLTYDIESLRLDSEPAADRGSQAVTAGDVTLLTPRGFIDSANLRAFERALESSHARKNRFAILDLSRVHYINSSGISAIIRYFGMYQERKGLLVLAAVPRSVGLSMHLLGVTSLIPFHKDVRSARRYCGEVAEGRVSPPGVPETIAAGRRKKVLVPLRPLRTPLGDARVLLLTPGVSRFTRVMARRYERLQVRFTQIEEVEEAVGVIDRETPDLLVVDQRLDPDGNFVTRLKMQPELSLISIVKIYPREFEGVGEKLDFKVWENDFLVDPFQILELFSLIEAELRRVPKDRKVFQQQIRVEFRTTRQNVEKASRLIDAVIRGCMAHEEDRTALFAAIKEGVDNAALHGNRWNDSKTVDVNFLVDRSKVTVIIEDDGEGFDFEYYLQQLDDQEAFEKAKKRIVLEGRRGGLGILLMSRCTDRIEYAGVGNILRLEKNL